MSIMEHVHTNGSGQRGRIAPALPSFTFKDSGITIKIRKVGPTTHQRIGQLILKEMPKPEPPAIETELGTEQNAADPAYEAAVAAWQQKTNNELSQRLMLMAALEAEVTIDDQARIDIARKKRHLGIVGVPHEDNPDLTTEENEKVFYILHVAASTPEELSEFGKAVLVRSVPTEEAVQAQITTFRSDIPE